MGKAKITAGCFVSYSLITFDPAFFLNPTFFKWLKQVRNQQIMVVVFYPV